MSDMMTFKINGEGEDITFDPTDFPYPTGVEFERQTKMGVAKFLSEQSAGTNQSSAALFWKGAVEATAARTGSSFAVAARQLPYEQFRTTLNIGKTYKSVRDPDKVDAPEDGEDEPDPTQPTPIPSPAPMSPATSDSPPPATPSPTPASGTSGFSPTTSASAPGSGTASLTTTSAI